MFQVLGDGTDACYYYRNSFLFALFLSCSNLYKVLPDFFFFLNHNRTIGQLGNVGISIPSGYVCSNYAFQNKGINHRIHGAHFEMNITDDSTDTLKTISPYLGSLLIYESEVRDLLEFMLISK